MYASVQVSDMTWWIWVLDLQTHTTGLDIDLQQRNIVSRMKHLATAARPGQTIAGVWHKSERDYQAEVPKFNGLRQHCSVRHLQICCLSLQLQSVCLQINKPALCRPLPPTGSNPPPARCPSPPAKNSPRSTCDCLPDSQRPPDLHIWTIKTITKTFSSS